MNYQDTLDFLFSQLPMYQRDGKAAYKANLDTTIALDEHFRFPHKMFRTIHVAGTNGKGSVSHMLASVFEEAGYKTGLYTSPHLTDYRERIRINGKKISETFVTRFVEHNRAVITELKPSFFEITVALAFDYFAREQVDIAIIETGMGGRLDSTNIITPLASVITNIGFDHTRFLGNTIAEIATEKAGIIKEETPVVIGEKQPEAMDVYMKKSQQLAAPVNVAPDRFEIQKSTISDDFKLQVVDVYDRFLDEVQHWELDLVGAYQAKNLLAVLTTLDVVRGTFPATPDQVQRGLKHVRCNTGFAGRWQVLQHNPLAVADTAHNKEGLTMVMEQLSNLKKNHLHMVVGMVDDKNIPELLSLFPTNATYYFTKPSIPRAFDEKELHRMAADCNLKGEAYATVAEAWQAARNAAKFSDVIFVGGSTFVVAEVV
ncbi:MAG: folylpolyglutamate synthase/dihydrofolate synthase family protein [Salinivirgaceae bacterium]